MQTLMDTIRYNDFFHDFLLLWTCFYANTKNWKPIQQMFKYLRKSINIVEFCIRLCVLTQKPYYLELRRLKSLK